MVACIVDGVKFVGASGVLPTVIAHLVGGHVLVKEYLTCGMAVLHFGGQVRHQVSVVHQSVMCWDLYLHVLRQCLVGEPGAAEIVHLNWCGDARLHQVNRVD